MKNRYIPGVTRDRRKQKGDDLWGKTLRWLGVASWVLMFTFLAFTEKISGTEGAATSGSSSSVYIFLLMILGLAVSICGFMIIQKRNRRYSDEYTYSVLVLGLVSTCGIIYYIFVL
jgi:uncharacterized membrane protein